jgi:hypothetical protein
MLVIECRSARPRAGDHHEAARRNPLARNARLRECISEKAGHPLSALRELCDIQLEIALKATHP